MSALGKARRAWFVAGALLVLVFVGLPLLRLARNRAAVARSPLAPVVAGEVVRGSISDSLRFPGILSPQSTIAVVPKIAGKILEIRVREGDAVVEDQVIAILDDRIPRLQAEQAKAGLEAARAQRDKAVRGVRPEELENARATLDQAEKDLEAARSNFDRTAKLHQSGGVPKSKYEEAENAIRQADVQVQNARRMVKLMEEGSSREDLAMAGANEDAMRAQYEIAALQLEWAVVRAPVSGIVAKVMGKAGNMAAPGVPLTALVQDASVIANISLPEKFYGRVTEAPGGVRVTVRPIAYGGERAFEGRVTAVAESVDPQSRTFAVEASIRNPGRALKPGMYVDAELVLETWAGALLAPEEALVERGGGLGIFAIVAGEKGGARARFVPVEAGVRRGGLALVRPRVAAAAATAAPGAPPPPVLAEGLAVVVEGNAFLEEGQAVAVIDRAAVAEAAKP